MKSLSLFNLNALNFKNIYACCIDGETVIPGALSAGSKTPTWGRY
jgi:hypothetical protein